MLVFGGMMFAPVLLVSIILMWVASDQSVSDEAQLADFKADVVSGFELTEGENNPFVHVDKPREHSRSATVYEIHAVVKHCTVQLVRYPYEPDEVADSRDGRTIEQYTLVAVDWKDDQVFVGGAPKSPTPDQVEQHFFGRRSLWLLPQLNIKRLSCEASIWPRTLLFVNIYYLGQEQTLSCFAIDETRYVENNVIKCN
ncbi:MAG: hypothetical protein PVI21_01925 [Candidatus Woesebacteria bacterium]